MGKLVAAARLPELEQERDERLLVCEPAIHRADRNTGLFGKFGDPDRVEILLFQEPFERRHQARLRLARAALGGRSGKRL